MGIFFILITATSALMTAYPQHIYINGETRIEALKFYDNNSVLLKGNQVSYGAGDIIPTKGVGRDYIRITGNQIQINSQNYNEGIRTVTAGITQNVVFLQKIGSVKADRPSQILVDTTYINLIPMNDTIYNVNAGILGTKESNNYNIQYIQNIVYINENGIMLKFTKTAGVITIDIVGFDRHKNIIVRTL